MANINQIITLGIGTPSGIKEFITFGLQINPLAPSLWTEKINAITSWADKTDASTTWSDKADATTNWTDIP